MKPLKNTEPMRMRYSKGWKKTGKDEWIRHETKGDFGKAVEIEIRNVGVNAWNVDIFEHKGAKNSYKRFKTKSEAIRFANKYMRKH